MQLSWITCQSNDEKTKAPCTLNLISSASAYWEKQFGVYIIWRTNGEEKVIKVGQGDILTRLTDHQSDDDIQAYEDDGLLVTWAEVSPYDADGVENFLGNLLNPLVGSRFPDVTPIQVNLPEFADL